MKEKTQVQNVKLRHARELRGWTQRDLADQISLADVRTLRRWEYGEAFPSAHYRVKLCELLNVSAEELDLLPKAHLPRPDSEERYPNEMSPQLSQPLPSVRTDISPSLPKAVISSSQKWNRQRLLKKVQTFWIKGVLEYVLHNIPHLTLEFFEHPDMITNPWTDVIPEAHRSSRPVPTGIDILQFYDEACNELLILGEPGSGKTTLLLELTRELLARAYEDANHPIPVVLNLSSWSQQYSSFAAWMIDELSSKYQVPQRNGVAWVDNDQILPLLDGLDEVQPAFRKACVDAINAYRNAHGLVPLVVCSRREEYGTLNTLFLLQRSICIQKLIFQQIDSYLTGDELAAVRYVWSNDVGLQELITTPLMLSILVQQYRGCSVDDLQGSDSAKTRRQQLFAVYVERMLKRRPSETYYPDQKSLYWLKQLARQMQQRYETEFHIERMQLDWLPTPRYQQICRGLFVGLRGGLLSGVLISCISIPLSKESFNVIILAFALTTMLLVGIHKGGEACIKHVLLRFVLYLNGLIPWNYAHFLDYAAEHMLLCKVGGGYMFANHLLLEYFAELE